MRPRIRQAQGVFWSGLYEMGEDEKCCASGWGRTDALEGGGFGGKRALSRGKLMFARFVTAGTFPERSQEIGPRSAPCCTKRGM
jgi:hypothetical protein